MAKAHPRSSVIQFYPETDHRPMSETDDHRDILLYLVQALKLWFRRKKQVYVSGNLMMYYVEGDANLCVSPDVFVVKGVEDRQRRVYKTWEEGKGPDVVIEVSSRSTKSEDLITKLELYRDVLGVKEYYLYDPLREYLPTRLRAWERRGRGFVERRVTAGRVESRELALALVDEDGRLRLVDSKTGRALPDLAEAEDRADAEAGRAEVEAGRAEAEAAARQAAEARARALEAELERLRGKPPSGR